MRIGQFFSLRQGRVGQYLSSRVLIVRKPFQKSCKPYETCYFGFEKLSQAQKFAQNLALSGYPFQLQRSQLLTQFSYEIKLSGHTELARVLAHWDRVDAKRIAALLPSPAHCSLAA
jgi:hypothetical protein